MRNKARGRPVGEGRIPATRPRSLAAGEAEHNQRCYETYSDTHGKMGRCAATAEIARSTWIIQQGARCGNQAVRQSRVEIASVDQYRAASAGLTWSLTRGKDHAQFETVPPFMPAG